MCVPPLILKLKTALYSRVSGRHFKETMSVVVHGVARNGKSTFYLFNTVALGLIKGFDGTFCTATAHVGIYCIKDNIMYI